MDGCHLWNNKSWVHEMFQTPSENFSELVEQGMKQKSYSVLEANCSFSTAYQLLQDNIESIDVEKLLEVSYLSRF